MDETPPPTSSSPSDRDIEEILNRRRRALADLMHSPVMAEGDMLDAVHQITETAALLLNVGRASVWRLVDQGAAIECIDLYERGPSRHTSGTRIAATEVPRYFEALQRERAIRADDARADPRTSEFRRGYLEPLGITAMLDAPIFVRGAMVGVVCHEHSGSARRWSFAEELLAGTFADFVALVLETSSWHQSERALRVERDALESKVEERTRELRDSEANMRAMLELSPISMVLTRMSDHTVVFANRRAAEMFEIPIDAVPGRLAPEFWVAAADRERFLSGLFRNGRIDDLEAQMCSASGRRFWARVSGQRLRFAGEDTLLGAMVDITEQKQAQDRLRDLATRDVLTGTFNRRYVEDVVRRELERSQRYSRPLTVAMLDADHFKNVNDTYGHPVGDDVLRAISDRCRALLRTNDVLGRYGGEEFVVVFPETNLDDARIVAERLRAAIAENPIAVGKHTLKMTVSIGLSTLAPGQDAGALLARADAALYAAKNGGRNLVRSSA